MFESNEFNVEESSLDGRACIFTTRLAEICSLFKRMHYLNTFCRGAVHCWRGRFVL